MKTKLIPLLLIYVIMQQNGQTIKAVWSDGQPVDQLLQNKQKEYPDMTYQIVDKDTYDSIVIKESLPDTSINVSIPVNLKDNTIPLEDRFQALITQLGIQ